MHKISGTVFNIGLRYQPKEYLGAGSYGAVISCWDTITKRDVAIKKLHKLDDMIDAKRLLREIRLTRYMSHENTLELLDIIYDEYEKGKFGILYLVYPLLDTDLLKIIASKQELSDEHIQYIIYQIVRGIYFMHSANIVHRDLKPSNILTTEDCEIKICDFGLARAIEDPNDILTEYVVTRFYRAPEIMLSSHGYSKAVDLWSLGCTFAELMTNKVLFPGKNYIQQMKFIINRLGKPTKKEQKIIKNPNALKFIQGLPPKPRVHVKSFLQYENEKAIDLLNKMLQYDPVERITAKDALEHPYFEDVHDPDDVPVFEGSIDFTFENDKKLTIQKVKFMLIDEHNYFKKIYNEPQLDKKTLLKQWRTFELTGKVEGDEKAQGFKPKTKLQKRTSNQ